MLVPGPVAGDTVPTGPPPPFINMKSIHTLVPDIQELVTTKGWFTDALAADFAGEVSRRLQEKFNEERGTPRLRLSKMGPECPHALWHSIYHPEMAQKLPPWAEIKFSFGHIIEALAICLAKAAGHTVVGEQDELELDGVKGHRDCVIDGCLVDVKSSSSPSYIKFKAGTIAQDDSFGYLDQLDAYLGASQSDPMVTVKDKAYLLAIDKQLGHMCTYEHTFREESIRERIASHKEVVAQDRAPQCMCGTEPDGKSGNITLDTKASYNAFKYVCFPNLRTFLYSNGPRYLTQVERRPKRQDGSLIPEVDKYGQFVYN